MYVCICNAITQDMLDTAIKQGQSEKEVMNKLGVGNSCGVCLLEQVQSGLAKKQKSSNTTQTKKNLSTSNK